MILIYDYGIGNTGSISNMIKKIGLDSEVSSDVSLVSKAKFCIIPGVGSFDACITEFNKQESSELLLQRISSGLKTLGICVGMQMLFEKSEEGSLEGLNLIPGEVKKFNSFNSEFKNKMPHMSWNFVTRNNEDVTYVDFDKDPKFYFVHSYHVVCSDEYISGYAEYGHQFPASVRKGNIYGVQFHPEKSHIYGMNLLKSFFKHAS